MSLLRDKTMKNLLIYLILFSLLFLLSDVVISINWQNKYKTALLNQQIAAASVLSENGVPKNVIAKALTSTESTAEGVGILGKLGITEISDLHYLNNEIIYIETFKNIILSVIIFIVVTLFLSKREKLYQSAIKDISDSVDYNLSLPQSDEASIYRLFECINNMSAVLRSKQENEQKTKEFLKQTVSDISHQLKTPLAALSMYNEIIIDEPDNVNTVIDFAKKSETAIDRIKTLIMDLLKITRLDAGGIVFDKKGYPVKEIINKSIENLTERAKIEGKEIVIYCKNESVQCDINWTSEAISSIVKNALDHTHNNGIISISCEPTPMETRIIISDNGNGIAPEDFHHIFKRFYRSKNSSDLHGIGLGLPLAKAIVEGQGGIISVESEKNRGTVFTVSFPY